MRIKFIDTGEELEVTRAEQIDGTKVAVGSPEQSQEIQESAIKLGFSWGASDRYAIQHRDKPCLFFDCEEYGYYITWSDGEPFPDENLIRQFEFLPSQPSGNPGEFKPVSQPQQIQRGEITPEALEAEGWEIVGKDWEKGTPRKFKRGNVFAEFLTNGHLILHTGGGTLKGVSTFQDLRTLDRLVNGVAIPSKTNN